MVALKKTDSPGSDSATGDRGSFLGVAHSAKGLAWRERLAADMQPDATALAQGQCVPDLMSLMLAARCWSGAEA